MSNESLRWMRAVMPERCIDELFVKFNLFHVECLKVTLSKCLGFAIILGATIVKVPQVLKLYQAGSACGINIFSVLLELVAVTTTLVYSVASGFPFSSYGEALFLVLQTALIVSQVFYYNRSLHSVFMFLATYSAALLYLLSPAVPMALLASLQAALIPIVIVSKMIQFVVNYRNSSTGELSAITVLLLSGGSVARIFTSIQETGDALVIASYVTAAVCNCLIGSQILYYWNSRVHTKRD